MQLSTVCCSPDSRVLQEALSGCTPRACMLLIMATPASTPYVQHSTCRQGRRTGRSGSSQRVVARGEEVGGQAGSEWVVVPGRASRQASRQATGDASRHQPHQTHAPKQLPACLPVPPTPPPHLEHGIVGPDGGLHPPPLHVPQQLPRQPRLPPIGAAGYERGVGVGVWGQSRRLHSQVEQGGQGKGQGAGGVSARR